LSIYFHLYPNLGNIYSNNGDSSTKSPSQENIIILFCAFINSFISDSCPGNFKPGNGEWTIFESVESDKSLLRFFPDYTVLLNIGTDHYSKEELVKVPAKQLRDLCPRSNETHP